MKNTKQIISVLIIFILFSLTFSSSLALQEYTIEYDANGNTIKDNFYSYEYNSFNQLKKVYNSEGQLIEEYKYDENGERILKKEYFNGETQTTYYVNKDFIRIVNSTGSYDFVYYYDDRGNLLGRKDPDGKKYFYHPDHLGSTSIVTDEEGNVVEETSYTPFGALLTGGKSKFLYTGKEKDNTGLYYYGARYYNANFGRFTQPDTIIPDVYDPQSLNRYSYVRNNPYKYVDPDGHVAWDVTLDPMLLAWAINDYNNNPNFLNGLDVTLSSIGMAPVLPSLGIITRGGKIIDKGIDSLKFMLKNKKATYYGGKFSDEIIETGAKFSEKQLQKKFKHAQDFEVAGDYNLGNAKKFKNALKKHMYSKDIKTFKGTYRGDIKGTHYFNPNNNNWVFLKENGEFLTGWKLSPNQLDDLIKKGNIK